MTRQMKTPKQRAEDALGVAERRHTRAADTASRLEAELQDARDELDEATRLLAYAKQHPALQTANTTHQEGSNPA